MVNGTPCHVKDHCPALDTTLPVSNNSDVSSECELIFVPHWYESKSLTAEINAADGLSENTSEEEAKPVPLQRNAHNKRPCSPCSLCDDNENSGEFSGNNNLLVQQRKRT